MTRGKEVAHHSIVTILAPGPSFFASRTQATRFTADDEPRKRPSSLARWRDMATASASVTLQRRNDERLFSERYKGVAYRNASSMSGSASEKFFVSRLSPMPSTT